MHVGLYNISSWAFNIDILSADILDFRRRPIAASQRCAMIQITATLIETLIA